MLCIVNQKNRKVVCIFPPEVSSIVAVFSFEL